MSRPNIFKIATKELSQDGFFTWLLKWADPTNKQYNTDLHDCAKKFVELLVSKQINLSDDFKINKVEAGRQWENIDIWAEINDNILLIIEDKTFTKQHSKQLERYKEIAQNYCNKKQYQLVCLYLKTGNQSKSSLKGVTKAGYAIIDRAELLTFFKQHKVNNDIYTDFIERIESLEIARQSFRKQTIKDWTYSSWEGFYQFLEEKIDVTDWQYVANPAGGFLGLWWHFLEYEDYCIYLQIEQGNLCFKIGCVEENNGRVRNEWYSAIIKQAKKEERKEIHKPARFGSGNYMTVAIVDRKDWLGEDDSLFDENAVIERLKEYEKFLDRCLANNL